MPTAAKSPHFAGMRFVFLDRDGVINRKQPEGQYVTTPGMLELLPGAADAIATLNRRGFAVIVVTNQRGVAEGVMTQADLDRIHAHLRAELALHGASLDAIYTCTHDRNQCTCRKPQTGMIDQAFRDFPQASAANSILIGDSLSDIQCAQAAGMPAILIAGDPTRRKPGFETAASHASASASSLAEAISFLVPEAI